MNHLHQWCITVQRRDMGQHFDGIFQWGDPNMDGLWWKIHLEMDDLGGTSIFGNLHIGNPESTTNKPPNRPRAPNLAPEHSPPIPVVFFATDIIEMSWMTISISFNITHVGKMSCHTTYLRMVILWWFGWIVYGIVKNPTYPIDPTTSKDMALMSLAHFTTSSWQINHWVTSGRMED